jgi:hypothetical protein
MIVLQLLPPIPHSLNFLSYVQNKFHFPLITDPMTYCDQSKSEPSTIYSPHDI